MKSWLCCLVVAAFSTTYARMTSASPIYPGIVAETVNAKASPPCTTCHVTPTGGLGTATKPFAAYLRSRGLVADDETSLRTALAAAAGEAHDSDDDGVSDIDELRAGTDPNSAAADLPPPQYGCGNMSGRNTSSASLAVLIGSVFGGLVARRRRRVLLRASRETRG